MAASTQKKALIVGPGFIGWNVLDLLVAEGYAVTGFVRRKEHAGGIKASGGSVVTGTLDDNVLITDQTALHDIIIHTATADHLPSVQAVLEGVKMRALKGQMTVFIHTSGTSVLDDRSKGMSRSDKVYHDSDRSEIDSVPDDAPHREIDLAIVKAQKELGESAKLAILIPPLIHGCKLSNPLMSRHECIAKATTQGPTVEAPFRYQHLLASLLSTATCHTLAKV